jgi:hypothetical protein
MPEVSAGFVNTLREVIHMGLRRDDELLYELVLPRGWFRPSVQPRLPERTAATVELLVVNQALRLLGTPQKEGEAILDFSGRLLATGGADEGQGRLRLPGSPTESVELTLALDGSLQLQRGGLRGVVTPAKNSLGVVLEPLLWFTLGRLLRQGIPREQVFTLVREEATPGLISGTLSLTDERDEPRKLRDETVPARRFRYRASGLGYPKERERGALWLGPQGEVLQSDLLPSLSATAPLALEKNTPAFSFKPQEGPPYRAEQGPGGGWSVTNAAGSVEAELDSERRVRRFTSRLTGTPLTGEWDGLALRYAYPTLTPEFVTPPKDGVALFLATLLLPEPLPKLAIGEKRPVLLLPLVTGAPLALPGTLTRLPDSPQRRRLHRLALESGLTAELESDARGLVRLTSNGALAIQRKP